MRYVIEIEDFAADAFVEANGKRFLSYRDLEEYGAKAVRKLNEKGKNAILSFSKDLTQAFLNRYSELFTEKKENGVLGIAIRDEVTVVDLVEKFECTDIPLEPD